MIGHLLIHSYISSLFLSNMGTYMSFPYIPHIESDLQKVPHGFIEGGNFFGKSRDMNRVATPIDGFVGPLICGGTGGA